MPSIHIKKYKTSGKRFFARLAQADVFSVIRFLIGALLVWSLLYFTGLSFVRSFVVVGVMSAISITALVSVIFNDGFRLPKTPIMYSLLGCVIAVILSALFSNSSLQESFIGLGVGTDTVMFIVLWTTLIAVIASVVHSNKQIFHLLSLVVVASGLAVLFYIVNDTIFGGLTGFAVGTMTIGILSVVLVSVIVFARQFFAQLCNHNLFFNLGTAILGSIGVAGLFIVHDFILWTITGVVALLSVTYALMQKIGNRNIATPWVSVILFFVVLAGLFIGGLQQNMQNESGSLYRDRPSFISTLHVTRDALLDSPVFGVGVHNFDTLWDKEKTLRDIVSPDAHLQYGFGFGYFPTFIATTGIVGLIAVVTVLVLFVSLGRRIVVYIVRNEKDDPLTLISWMLAFVMLVIGIMTVGDITIMLVTAVSFGLALAASVVNGHIAFWSPRVTFSRKKIPYTFVVTVLLLCIFIWMLYGMSRSFAAAQKYRSVLSQPVGQLSSINSLIQVNSLRSHDMYLRMLSSQYTAALVDRVAREDTTREQVQVLVDGALAAVRDAIAYNPNNYRNYLLAGEVYRQLGSFDVNGAYAEAEQSYNRALERKPYSSDVLVALSQLYLNQSDFDVAKQYAQIAYSVAPGRPDVYIVSAQIALAENNLDVASAYLAQAARIEPLNPRRWVDLGVVLFSQQQYAASAESFARAIAIAPNQEVYYYLGLSLKELGRTVDAEAIYDLLDEAGTQLPINNLKAPIPVVNEVLENTVEEEAE